MDQKELSSAQSRRIELVDRRNQVHNDFTFTCFLLSQLQNFTSIFPSGNDLLVEDSHPLVRILLRQFMGVLHKPFFIFEPPLRDRRRDRKVGRPVFRDPAPGRSPRSSLYASQRNAGNGRLANLSMIL